MKTRTDNILKANAVDFCQEMEAAGWSVRQVVADWSKKYEGVDGSWSWRMHSLIVFEREE